ncbi:MAG: tetratricopeptide repeat protein [Neisseriales bacterium]|nr:MAG: tetratricopeptide repeat protein [Neisseriales bacterium]
MAHHLDEQEKIEHLKRFWHQYGKWLTIALSALIVGYLGHIAYDQYQARRAYQAAEIYVTLDIAIGQRDFAKAQGAADQLINNYANTAYASRAALLFAKIAYLQRHIDQAKAKLNWVIENSDEPALQAIAQIRLATLLFNEKQYQAALAAIAALQDKTFDAQSLELKGDILRNLRQYVAAKAAYEAALKTLRANDPNRFLLEIKLSELGN